MIDSTTKQRLNAAFADYTASSVMQTPYYGQWFVEGCTSRARAGVLALQRHGFAAGVLVMHGKRVIPLDADGNGIKDISGKGYLCWRRHVVPAIALSDHVQEDSVVVFDAGLCETPATGIVYLSHIAGRYKPQYFGPITRAQHKNKIYKARRNPLVRAWCTAPATRSFNNWRAQYYDLSWLIALDRVEDPGFRDQKFCMLYDTSRMTAEDRAAAQPKWLRVRDPQFLVP